MNNVIKKHKELEQLYLNCKACRIHDNKGISYGDISKAKIMIIGQNPGQNPRKSPYEIIPFGMNTKNSKDSGALLLKLLNIVGIDRKEVYITNIIKCSTPKNRVPGKEEIKSCLGYLRHEIELQKPKIIILLGNIAKVTFHRNWFYCLGALENKIISIWHPSYVLRNRQLYETWVKDFKEKWNNK